MMGWRSWGYALISGIWFYRKELPKQASYTSLVLGAKPNGLFRREIPGCYNSSFTHLARAAPVMVNKLVITVGIRLIGQCRKGREATGPGYAPALILAVGAAASSSAFDNLGRIP
jgi:hypothetical protein